VSETSNTKPETAETETRRLRVYRFKRGDGGEHFDGFHVPVGPRTTLLDALRRIQRDRDPSLALRHSCMHTSCGTWGVQVDGRRGAGVRLLAPGPRRGDHGPAALASAERLLEEPRGADCEDALASAAGAPRLRRQLMNIFDIP